MGFSTDILSLIWDFFKTFINILVTDVASELTFMGQQIAMVLYSWGYAIGGYGIFAPLLLVVVVGVTIAGLFAVFVVLDTGKDLVGGE